MTEWITILPNLSIGVVAVISLVWYADKSQKLMQDIHNKHISEVSKMHSSHLEALNKREDTIRDVEKEVRTSITSQLVKNSEILNRVAIVLDKK